jgi:hypothetical protein
MSMTRNVILEFILGLLRDHEAAMGYCADPSEALCAAGLPTVTPEDLAALAPMVAESALVRNGAQLAAILATGAQCVTTGAQCVTSGASFVTGGSSSVASGAAAVDPWSAVDVSHAFGSGIGTSPGAATTDHGTLRDQLTTPPARIGPPRLPGR